MSKKFDVVAKIGQYTNRDGVVKAIYKNVGSVIETKNGLSIKMDACFNPAGCAINEDGSIWLNLYEPKENRAPDAAQQAYTAGISKQSDPDGLDQFNDFIPF